MDMHVRACLTSHHQGCIAISMASSSPPTNCSATRPLEVPSLIILLNHAIPIPSVGPLGAEIIHHQGGGSTPNDLLCRSRCQEGLQQQLHSSHATSAMPAPHKDPSCPEAELRYQDIRPASLVSLPVLPFRCSSARSGPIPTSEEEEVVDGASCM